MAAERTEYMVVGEFGGVKKCLGTGGVRSTAEEIAASLVKNNPTVRVQERKGDGPWTDLPEKEGGADG